VYILITYPCGYSTSGTRSGDLQRGGLQPLPGAQVELRQVSSLLTKYHWQVKTYSGEDALEERVKQVQGPRVLHLATHGFFLPDEERSKGSRPTGTEDPMLRSGLFFAGANRVISHVPSLPADLDDGVLTAYEASGLNLQGTELVVLSACQTGLGEVKNGEGVFGLRRALQEAGAESVLMSLWAVPDRETQELMTLFYGKWLSGMDKHEALRAAQLEMRRGVKARYGHDLPFYWGGFVLVGR
jgi:CHAT domain-containing protein